MKRYTIAAVVVLVVLAMAAPVPAGGVERGRMDIDNVVGFGVTDTGDPATATELLTYVGTVKFRGEGRYKIAFIAPFDPDPPPPDFFDTWIRFRDRWVIYEYDSIDFYPGGTLTFPTGGEVVRAARDRGRGHFAKNRFIGWGPGGIWAGRFVDEFGDPAPFHPPSGQFNTRFIGRFWLFGELDD